MGDSLRFPTRTRRRWSIRLALIFSDILMLGIATTAATVIRWGQLRHVQVLHELGPTFTFIDLSLLIAVIAITALWVESLYDLDRVFWGTREYKRVARALSLAVVVFIVATFALKLPGLSRAWTLMAWSLGILFVCIGRATVRIAVVSARRRGRLLTPTLVAGFNQEAVDIVRALRANRSSGLVPVGCLASEHADYPLHDYCSDLGLPCLGEADNVGDILERNQIDTVLISSTAYDHDVLARLIDSLRDRNVDIQMSSGLLDVITSRVQIREVSGIPLISLRGVAFSPGRRFVKRVFDLLVGGFIVLIGLPVWLLIALAIKLDSRGSVFYRQMRVGREGRVFGMYKFRSMCDGADARLADLAEQNEATGPLFKMRNDPRVTRVGGFLRKFSLDEFPQLLNVLQGEMSLVGPRPLPTQQTVDMTEMQSRRHEVLPGMTGLWQVSGRSTLTFDEMVRLDLLYIENWSVGYDLALLARTVPTVLLPDGAY